MGDHRSGEEVRLDDLSSSVDALWKQAHRTNVLLQRIIDLMVLRDFSPQCIRGGVYCTKDGMCNDMVTRWKDQDKE